VCLRHALSTRRSYRAARTNPAIVDCPVRRNGIRGVKNSGEPEGGALSHSVCVLFPLEDRPAKVWAAEVFVENPREARTEPVAEDGAVPLSIRWTQEPLCWVWHPQFGPEKEL